MDGWMDVCMNRWTIRILDQFILKAYLCRITSSLLKRQTPSWLPWLCVLPLSPSWVSLTLRWKQQLSHPPRVRMRWVYGALKHQLIGLQVKDCMGLLCHRSKVSLARQSNMVNCLLANSEENQSRNVGKLWHDLAPFCSNLNGAREDNCRY